MTTSPNDKVLTLFDGAGETGAALVDASDMVHPSIQPPPTPRSLSSGHAIGLFHGVGPYRSKSGGELCGEYEAVLS